MTKENFLLVYIFIQSFVSVFCVNYFESQGKQDACKSIGLEWVKDKCMKVTRENV